MKDSTKLDLVSLFFLLYTKITITFSLDFYLTHAHLKKKHFDKQKYFIKIVFDENHLGKSKRDLKQFFIITSLNFTLC